MKKLIFGGLLFVMGTIGVIAMVVAGIAQGPWGYHGSTFVIEGWFAAILGMRALAPFVVFCLMSALGCLLCAFVVFGKEKALEARE